MLPRNEGGASYTQGWDPEKRLQTVTGSASATFVYDGDGNRVKAMLNDVTTAYVGNYYEQSGSITTTYYYAGGTRVAMRQGITVSYLLGDHLGSTSITANGSGGLSAELRYKPWGESRYANGTTPTRRQYTGQINDSEIGLYFYGARLYAPALGRFVSADSIVPGAADGSGGGAATLGYDKSTRLTPLTTDFREFIAQVGDENREVLQYGPFFQWDDKVRQEHNVPMGPLNPRALNRYAYTANNPLKYTDPSGHCFLLCGFIGAIAGAVGSFISQVVQGEGTLQERIDNVNWNNVKVAAGVGFVAGTLTPMVATTLGAATLGAGANPTQYVLTQAVNNQPITAQGVAVKAASGALAGGVMGPASQIGAETVAFDVTSEWLDKAAAQSVNDQIMKGLYTGASNLTRSLAGGIASNWDWTKH